MYTHSLPLLIKRVRLQHDRLAELSPADRRRWQCGLVEKDGQVVFQIEHLGETKEHMPEEIIRMIMEKLKETAEHFIGEEVDAAVLTVPVAFTEEQRAPIVKVWGARIPMYLLSMRAFIPPLQAWSLGAQSSVALFSFLGISCGQVSRWGCVCMVPFAPAQI